jgi:membrane fusion protein, multidrug efflux system
MSQSAAHQPHPNEPLDGDERPGEERGPGSRVTPLNRHTSPSPAADASPPSRRLVIGVLIALVIAAGATWFMRSGTSKPAATTSTVAPPLELAQVDVEVAQVRVLTRTLPISGSIAPLAEVTVKAKSGGEVREINVLEGQDLASGDVIARIDARNQRAQYDREMAAVEKARADLELAKLNRDKNRTLLEQRYISQNTFESTESTYAGSAANLKLAEAQARVAEIALWDSVIRSPLEGTVARRAVQPGEKVSPDSPIVTIVDLRQMLLEAAVPAADIPAVQTGQAARFTVTGFGQRQFEGKVQRINPTTAENSRAIMVYIEVANPDRSLKGGMFAQGELLLGEGEPVLAVPRSAVRTEAGVAVVYTLQDGKIVRRQVTTGASNEDSDYVEIKSGLQPGERVIIPDIGDRKPGDAVVVRGAPELAR